MFSPTLVHSQGLELSVTPTLFEMSATPQQVWSSSVKVINSNPYPITVFAEVVNFAPQGESGQARFLPILEEQTEGVTLAEWFEVNNEPITIEPETSAEVPFTVRVPEDASPGGHFAAIMVGTKPPDTENQFQVSTSQIVTALFFVRVAGDVVEDGRIREFAVDRRFVGRPTADFVFRFENRGNVHLQPQGEIYITNMWGKERGVIPINKQSNFGNVLPESIRKFDYAWESAYTLTDIGRYTAEMTVGYGTDDRQFHTSIAHFYVIPIKGAVLTVLALVTIVLFARWCIQSYVRRLLLLSGVSLEDQIKMRHTPQRGDVAISLQQESAAASSEPTALQTFVAVVRSWGIRVWLVAFGVLLVVYLLFGFLSRDVGSERKDYDVTIGVPGAEVNLSAEEVIFNREYAIPDLVNDQGYEIHIINVSGTPGKAAAAKAVLIETGYAVAKIDSEVADETERTVIVYPPESSEVALNIQRTLGVGLISASNDASKTVTIYTGSDYMP